MDRRKDDDGENRVGVGQQSRSPSVQDPKLWMVECVIGSAQETVVCLMQKYTDKGAELQIRSAFKLGHIMNYIFIEADEAAHVREACKGFHNLDAQKILRTSIKQMSTLLSAGRKVPGPGRKVPGLSGCRWVRMKIGIYKGDLAKVVNVDHGRQKITVKLIPRIDLQALANKREGREAAEEKALLPPPRLMNVDEVRETRMGRRKYHAIIGGTISDDGFLYKTVPLKSLRIRNIKPTFDELEKF
ncbi:putative transcription elongation factor SPT5 homolog 1 [Mercurialis annua]|uniref:putative transcription elongation factor SPT5 homolog 1 n=1 Tax=Mercurialis annua TaxID=3986 RepID=UPI0024ADA43F|nr:putative transcription elongation factor SPT5 homolog 1 [Mercurialis annua]